MENFLKTLKKRGYKKNTLETYRRVLKNFHSFLDIYSYDFKKFNEDELYNYLKLKYKTEKSLRTAISVIQRFLKFKNISRKLSIPSGNLLKFKEFRKIGNEEFRKILSQLEKLNSEDIIIAIILMVKLGLSPSEIEKLRVSSYGTFMDVPILQEGRIKRFVIDSDTKEILDRIRKKRPPASPLLNVNRNTLKVTFHRIMKQTGLKFRVSDFQDNYIAELLKLELPIDIVVEFSGSNLERVSYINRILTLESKADIIEKRFKKLRRDSKFNTSI